MSTTSAALVDPTVVETRPDLITAISQLEESLRVSQHALLLHDLATFEQQTSVQARLTTIIADYLRVPSSETSCLGVACRRVLHLGRVHLGLLRRARRSLRALSHLLACPESGHGSINHLRALSNKQSASQQEG